MIVLSCCYIILLVIGISQAIISSKCPELQPIPSATSPALLVGIVQDVVTSDKHGEYGVVLLLQHVIRGEDVMKDTLSQNDTRYNESQAVIGWCLVIAVLQRGLQATAYMQ